MARAKTATRVTNGLRVKGGPLAKADSTPRVRVRVNKAYKMFVGGAFVRSESGRYFQVRGATDSADPETVNIPRG